MIEALYFIATLLALPIYSLMLLNASAGDWLTKRRMRRTS